MDKHITTLGVLYIALNIPVVLAAMIVFTSVAGGGLLSGDTEAIAITAGVGAAIFYFLLLISVPGIIGGIGLLRRRRWARILMLILGCLNLLSIPIGTALGIYTLWVLLKEESVQLFA